MARRLPTKMWAVAYSDGSIPVLWPTKHACEVMSARDEGARIGRVTIVWEKPAKKKARR